MTWPSKGGRKGREEPRHWWVVGLECVGMDNGNFGLGGFVRALAMFFIAFSTVTNEQCQIGKYLSQR